MQKTKTPLDDLVDRVTPGDKPGEYDPNTQTWSHRSMPQLSPVKHHQEM